MLDILVPACDSPTFDWQTLPAKKERSTRPVSISRHKGARPARIRCRDATPWRHADRDLLAAHDRTAYVGATLNSNRPPMSLRQNLRDMKETLRQSAEDLDAPGARMRAWLHFLIFDHGILRTVWTNEAEIAPGVFRANHPSPSRLARLEARGTRTILNLRGTADAPHYRFERDACAELGLTLVDFDGLRARKAPRRRTLLELLEIMRRAEKPILMHCKSGADRSSLAAAIYLLAIEKAPLAEARRQFSPFFIHFRWTKTGVLDHILDAFEADHGRTGIGFEDWLRTEYSPLKIQSGFNKSRR